MNVQSGGRCVIAVVAATLLASGALAHHGWSWADQEQTELTGTIVEIYIGPPHPTLEVETADDGVWTVELGNPRQTEAAGFVEGVARPGDEVIAIGHRSPIPDQRLMKAVRVTVNGQNYDPYPDRIRGN